MAAVVVFGLAAQASAGLKLTSVDGDNQPTSLIAQDGMVGQVDDESGMVIDCRSGEVTLWDNESRSAWRGVATDMVADWRAQVEDQKQQLVALLEKSGSTNKAGAVQSEALGKRTIAGYDAVGYRLSQTGPLGETQVESWFSPALKTQVERETGRCDALTRLEDAALLFGGDAIVAAHDRLTAAHGFVVSQTLTYGGQTTLLSQLQSVEQVEAPASQLAAPAGYALSTQSYADFMAEAGE
ncbi:MAG TPA: hypothetical protein VFK80_00065 [Limnochordia bacterium]|nr:hypothetical protein [Limnochordia bacterium]